MASKFYLMNENDRRYEMNTVESGVFTEPSGFGIAYDASYLPVGDTWIADKRTLSQPEITGKMQFHKDHYTTFQKFANFINTARRLVFIYQPSGVETEYLIDVDAVSIDKGYFAMGHIFEVPVKFAAKSLFYTEKEYSYRIERASEEMRWDFTWETKFNDMNNVQFTFDNDGHVESPFTLSFTGHCTNPSMEVYQNGVLIHKVAFYLTVTAAETLTISTFDDDLFIEVNGIDRKDCLDFTNENFFKLPAGKCEIYFRQETGKLNNVLLSLEKYYKAV